MENFVNRVLGYCAIGMVWYTLASYATPGGPLYKINHFVFMPVTYGYQEVDAWLFCIHTQCPPTGIYYFWMDRALLFAAGFYVALLGWVFRFARRKTRDLRETFAYKMGW